MNRNNESFVSPWMESIYSEKERFLEEVSSLEQSIESLFASSDSANLYDCLQRIRTVKEELKSYIRSCHTFNIADAMGQTQKGIPVVVSKHLYYPEEVLCQFMILERLLKTEGSESQDIFEKVQNIKNEIQIYIDGRFKREEKNNGES